MAASCQRSCGVLLGRAKFTEGHLGPTAAPDEIASDQKIADDAPASRGVQLNEDNAMPAGDPQYGERVDETKPKRAPRKKPTE